MKNIDFKDFCHRFGAATIGIRFSKDSTQIHPVRSLSEIHNALTAKTTSSKAVETDTDMSNWAIVGQTISFDDSQKQLNRKVEKIWFKDVLARGGEVILSCPSLGYISYRDFALFVKRVPMRQFRMGFVLRTLKGFDPTQYENHLLGRFSGRPAIDRTFPSYVQPQDLSWSCYNKQYFSIDEAVEKINSCKRLGCPVTSNIAIVAKAGSKYPALYYKEHCVGYFDKHIYLYHQYRELFETFQELGKPIEIKE